MSQSKKFMRARGYDVKEVFSAETGNKIRFGKGSRKDLQKIERKLRKLEAKEAHELKLQGEEVEKDEIVRFKLWKDPKEGLKAAKDLKEAPRKDSRLSLDSKDSKQNPIKVLKEVKESKESPKEVKEKELKGFKDYKEGSKNHKKANSPYSSDSGSQPSDEEQLPLTPLAKSQKKRSNKMAQNTELGVEKVSVCVEKATEVIAELKVRVEKPSQKLPQDPREFLERFAKVGMTEDFKAFFEEEEKAFNDTLRAQLEDEIAALQGILSR